MVCNLREVLLYGHGGVVCLAGAVDLLHAGSEFATKDCIMIASNSIATVPVCCYILS